MDLNFRWVWLDDAKVCLSIAAHGNMQTADFKEVFRSVGEALASVDGATLIDLRQARWNLAATDIAAVALAFKENRLRMGNKIALVCSRDIDRYGELLVVASAASNQGLKARAFYDLGRALEWMAQKPLYC
ncbi:MAG TPA: hypothetical protein VGA73_00200 [Candidatus Binatia bacterium]